MIKVLFLLLFSLSISSASAQIQQRVLYKQVDTNDLYMDVYSPNEIDPKASYPSIVFFFGGGWKGGSIEQHVPHAKYFSNRGLVCFLVEYRVHGRHKTSPFESLKDAKSAIRFIKKNASVFNIDTSKIIASGGSAGGHLAAATALIPDYNEDNDDLSVSCIPNALVLFNPVIDNGPGGYGYERIGNQYKSFSPLHNIKEGAPPTLFFLGTEDHLIPVITAQYYKMVMEKVGSRCDLSLFEGEVHGFFYFKYLENYKKTIYEMDEFLKSLGYLEGKPQIYTLE